MLGSTLNATRARRLNSVMWHPSESIASESTIVFKPSVEAPIAARRPVGEMRTLHTEAARLEATSEILFKVPDSPLQHRTSTLAVTTDSTARALNRAQHQSRRYPSLYQ